MLADAVECGHLLLHQHASARGQHQGAQQPPRLRQTCVSVRGHRAAPRVPGPSGSRAASAGRMDGPPHTRPDASGRQEEAQRHHCCPVGRPQLQSLVSQELTRAGKTQPDEGVRSGCANNAPHKKVFTLGPAFLTSQASPRSSAGEQAGLAGRLAGLPAAGDQLGSCRSLRELKRLRGRKLVYKWQAPTSPSLTEVSYTRNDS